MLLTTEQFRNVYRYTFSVLGNTSFQIVKIFPRKKRETVISVYFMGKVYVKVMSKDNESLPT